MMRKLHKTQEKSSRFLHHSECIPQKTRALSLGKSGMFPKTTMASTRIQPQKQIKEQLGPQIQKVQLLPPELYFSRQKRKTMYCGVVDKYFEKKKLLNSKKNKNRLSIQDKYWSTYQKANIIAQNTNLKRICTETQNFKEDQRQKRTKTLTSFFSKPEKKNLPIIQERSERKGFEVEEQRQKVQNDWDSIDNILSEQSEQVTFPKVDSQNLDPQSKSIYKNTYFSIKQAEKGTYLKIFSNIGQPILSTIEKVYEYKIQKVWHLIDQFGGKALKCHINPSLRQELFRIKKHSTLTKFHIIAQQAYELLFVNEYEWLVDVIRGITEQLLEVEGRVLNNKICLDNVQKLGEKDIRIVDWGCSATRSITGSTTQLINYTDPVLCDGSEWLAYPEYLAPQILKSLTRGTFSRDVWKCYRSDIWSLGCLIFQILSMVPLWMPHECIIGTKNIQKGFLGQTKRNLQLLYQQQQKVPSHINQWIRQNTKKIKPSLTFLMKKMLSLDPEHRPSPTQILNTLKI